MYPITRRDVDEIILCADSTKSDVALIDSDFSVFQYHINGQFIVLK